MNIAIIPARGGSKRIPGKNLRDFCGQPIIAWSIQAALNSQLFDQVIVSTDCPTIAKVSRMHGASVPFIRPAHLSDDFSSTLSVVRHAVHWLIEDGQAPSRICCLYATAPMVEPDDLKLGLELLESNPKLDFAFSVTHFGFPIQRALTIESGELRMIQPEHEMTRSQDLVETCHDAGQFYWGSTQAFLEQRGIYSARSAPVLIPNHRVQDIDTPEDWERAEWLFRSLRSQKIAA